VNCGILIVAKFWFWIWLDFAHFCYSVIQTCISTGSVSFNGYGTEIRCLIIFSLLKEAKKAQISESKFRPCIWAKLGFKSWFESLGFCSCCLSMLLIRIIYSVRFKA
jgi:hypothetical protein